MSETMYIIVQQEREDEYDDRITSNIIYATPSKT
jgi:hypothetical protein